MENASKALIIAGAILISILIITLGILIYQQAAGAINDNAFNEVEITTFNAKFTQYEGTSVSGATVRAMIQAVNASNAVNVNDITMKYKASSSATETTITTSNDIVSTSTYKVETAINGTTGYINTITITKN